MIKYAQEELTDQLIADLEKLIFLADVELWEDVNERIDLDWDAYRNMEKLGIFVVYTVRDENKLVGYCSFMVVSDPHYRGIVRALQDSIYVLPVYRSKGVGVGIIDWSELRLKEDFNVASIQQTVNTKIDFSPLLERKGYEFTEKAMVKRFA